MFTAKNTVQTKFWCSFQNLALEMRLHWIAGLKQSVLRKTAKEILHIDSQPGFSMQLFIKEN